MCLPRDAVKGTCSLVGSSINVVVLYWFLPGRGTAVIAAMKLWLAPGTLGREPSSPARPYLLATKSGRNGLSRFLLAVHASANLDPNIFI